MKRFKKIVSFASIFLMSVNFTVLAEIPKGTVVIGCKAYDLDYANDKKNLKEISEEVRSEIGEKKGKIYIKAPTGDWYDNETSKKVSKEFIPSVSYKNAEGTLIDYVEKDGEKIELKAVEVSFISERQIQIKFNKIVDKKSSENRKNYKIGNKYLEDKDNVELSDDGQTVLITLGYELKGENLKSSIYISKYILDVNKNPMNMEYSKDVLVLNTTNSTYQAEEEIKGDVCIVSDNVMLKGSKVEGTIYVNADGAVLQDEEFKGDVILNPGKEGEVTLKDIKAKEITVLSGGKDSIHLNNVKAEKVNVNSSSLVRIESKGKTKIENTIVNTGSIIDSKGGSFGDLTISLNDAVKDESERVVELRGIFQKDITLENGVTLKAEKNAKIANVKICPTDINSKIVLSGNFDKVEVNKEANVKVTEGEIKKLILNSKATFNLSKKANIKEVEDEKHNITFEGEGKDNVGKNNNSFGGGFIGGGFTGGGSNGNNNGDNNGDNSPNNDELKMEITNDVGAVKIKLNNPIIKNTTVTVKIVYDYGDRKNEIVFIEEREVKDEICEFETELDAGSYKCIVNVSDWGQLESEELTIFKVVEINGESTL